ncbi:hypothetical protein Tco_1174599 [Tanacetum coccineum]
MSESSSTGKDTDVNTPRSDKERLEHQDDLTDFVPPTPHDSPLSGGHTPGSDERRPNINELMAIFTNLSNRVLALEQSKTAQDLVNRKLKKKVRKLEKKLRARTSGMKLFKIGTSIRKSLDKENVSKQGRNLKTRPMFKEGDFDDDIDDMVNEAMENVEGDTFNDAGAVNTATTGVSSASASVTTAGVSISTAESRTPPTTTTTAFEDEDLSISQTLIKIRILKWLKTVKKGKAEGSRKKTVARKRTGKKLDDESIKRQKIEDDAKKEALRDYLDIILRDGEAVTVESLATKYPIVDWKTHALSEDKIFHVLLMDTGIAIHMLIEKTYPLTQEILSRIMSRRLEVDHECEMAYELLRFTRSQLKK